MLRCQSVWWHHGKWSAALICLSNNKKKKQSEDVLQQSRCCSSQQQHQPQSITARRRGRERNPPDSLRKKLNLVSSWVRRHFTNFVKWFFWKILNHLGLRVNSAHVVASATATVFHINNNKCVYLVSSSSSSLIISMTVSRSINWINFFCLLLRVLRRESSKTCGPR